MKTKILYLIAFMIACSFCACDDIENEPIDHDKTAPGPVSNVIITRHAGGATFTYNLPDDPDLLCVEAAYTLADGVQKTVRSSYHSRSISIEGFADTAEYIVSLACIDRSENKSEPLNITFRPMTPSVILALETLDMAEDFGGVRLTWSNPDKAALTILVSTPDTTGKKVEYGPYYSSSEDGDLIIDGLDTISRDFTVQFRDKWSNYSDTKTASLTPLYEVKLNRTNFRNLGGDYASNIKNTGEITRLWDNNFSDNAFGSSQVPWYASWDLGVKTHLSKVVIWQYAWADYKNYGHYYYGENGRHFKVYGTNTPDDEDSWIELQDCEIIKKSGLPIGYGREFMSDEDFDIARNQGHKFIIPKELPSVRYLRLESLSAWQGALGSPAEIEVYGDPR